jgi:hypothetical protein
MNLLRPSAVLLCCVLGGCATVNRMAFDKNTTSVDVSKKSVVLMTIDVSRPDKSRFQPEPFVIYVEKPNAQSKEERQNFKLDKKLDAVQTADGHKVFLARMALEPGPYKLVAMMGSASAFPINAFFQVPLVSDVNVKPSSVLYVGRVTATLRPRQPGEFRAGPLLPLIDQAVAGMSNSTWDVTIEDKSDADLQLFQQNFKAVEVASVVKAPLAPFDRGAAQSWWDNSSPKDKEETKADANATASTGATAGASH